MQFIIFAYVRQKIMDLKMEDFAFMNIDDKIKKFEQSCERLAQIDAEKLNEKLNIEIEEQIESELAEYVKKQENSYKKQCEKIVKDFNKSLFEYEIECKKNVQNVKEIINKELKEETKKRLELLVNKEEYFQLLLKKIKDSLEVANNDSSSVVFITNRDFQKYNHVLQEYNIKMEQLDDFYIGGCKLKNEKLGIMVDNTLKTSLDEI